MAALVYGPTASAVFPVTAVMIIPGSQASVSSCDGDEISRKYPTSVLCRLGCSDFVRVQSRCDKGQRESGKTCSRDVKREEPVLRDGEDLRGSSRRRSPAHRRAQLELPGHSANTNPGPAAGYRELEDQYCQVLAAVARADQPGVGGVKPRPVQRDSRSASCLHDLATRTTRGEQPDERASRGEHSESARQSKQQHLPLSGSTGGADRISRVSHDTFHLSW